MTGDGLEQPDLVPEQRVAVTNPWPARLRILTWPIAVAAVVVFGVLGFAWHWYDPVCSQQLATVAGSFEIVDVCRPLQLADPPVVAFILLVLLILWPGLSEFSVAGVTVKRLQKDVLQVGEKVDSVDRQLRLTNAIKIINVFGGSLPDETSSHEIAERLHGSGTGTIELTATATGDSSMMATDETITTFLKAWQEVESVNGWAAGVLQASAYDHDRLDISSGRAPRYPAPTWASARSSTDHLAIATVISGLTNRHSLELGAARSARNVLVHESADISESALVSLTDVLKAYLDLVIRSCSRIA